MLLSIIIPTYNCAIYLKRAIYSTKHITGCSVEIIVIDDGSTDNTPELIRAIEAEIPINYFRQNNSGLSLARNHGLSHAHGNYILLLDADDELAPCNLSELLDSGCDIIRIGVLEVFEDKPPLRIVESPATMAGREYLSSRLGNHTLYAPSWAYIYRLEWLRSNKIKFHENLLHEDDLFTVQALLKANTIIITPTIIYKYIHRRNSITTSKSAIIIKKRITSYIHIAKLLTDIGNTDTSFDLRPKIYEVLDGAYQLAYDHRLILWEMHVIFALIIFMFNYRGASGNRLIKSPYRRVLYYILHLIFPK